MLKRSFNRTSCLQGRNPPQWHCNVNAFKLKAAITLEPSLSRKTFLLIDPRPQRFGARSISNPFCQRLVTWRDSGITEFLWVFFEFFDWFLFANRLRVVSNFGDPSEIQARARKWSPAGAHQPWWAPVSREETRQEGGRRKLETTDKARDFELIAYIPRENSDWLYLGYLSTIHKPLSTLSIKFIQFQFTDSRDGKRFIYETSTSTNFWAIIYNLLISSLYLILLRVPLPMIRRKFQSGAFVEEEHAMRLTL